MEKKKKKEKTDEKSGHYVIASSRPPECQQLERRMLVPICCTAYDIFTVQTYCIEEQQDVVLQ